MKTKELIVAGIAVTLIVLFGAVWLMPAGVNEAPALTVNTLKGETIRLEELRGKPVLVNFWATTCPGCIKEMPRLIELYEELHPKGLEILAIAMSYDPPNQVMTMARQRNIPYPIALDLDETAAKAFGDVKLTPTLFLISPEGRIVQHTIGEVNMEKLQSTVERML